MKARLGSRRLRPDKQTKPQVSAGGVIFDEEGQVLLLRRADEGTWCFPKGRVETGETPEEAARREIREECGLDCRIGRKVAESRYSFYWPEDDVNYDKCVHYFLARPIGRELHLESLFDAAHWAVPDQARRMLFHKNDKEILRKAVEAAALSGRT